MDWSAIQQQRQKREIERQAGGWEIERKKCAADIGYWFDRYVWTYDPRLTKERNPDGTRKSPYVQFKLWPKQAQVVRWIGDIVDAIHSAAMVSGSICQRAQFGQS